MVQDIQDRKDPGVTVTPQRALLLIQPELVLNRAITPTGRLLWMVIETYRDQNSDQVVLSLDVAAADLSITRKTLLVHIAELEHHGLLSRKRGRHQNTYTLHRSPPTAREIPPPYRRRVEKLHSEPLTVEKLHPAHRVENLHPEPGSDEIVMSASLEVTGPQPVTSTPEGTEVPPVPSPEEPVLVTPEVPKVPTPSLPILGKGGVGGKPSFSAPPPEAEPTSIQQVPPPREPLSPKAHAFMEAHRAAFALRRPLSLNPALRIELEQAVEDLGLERLLVTLNKWAVLNDVRPVIKIIRGCRTSREGPEKRAMDAKRAVLAVPKPGQNKSSGSRQISRQTTSSEEYAAQAIENGMITIDDNDIRSMRPAVEAILRARGSL